MMDVFGDQWALQLARDEDDVIEQVEELPTHAGEPSLQRREPERDARVRTPPPGSETVLQQQPDGPGSGHHLPRQLFTEQGNAYVNVGAGRGQSSLGSGADSVPKSGVSYSPHVLSPEHWEDLSARLKPEI